MLTGEAISKLSDKDKVQVLTRILQKLVTKEDSESESETETETETSESESETDEDLDMFVEIEKPGPETEVNMRIFWKGKELATKIIGDYKGNKEEPTTEPKFIPTLAALCQPIVNNLTQHYYKQEHERKFAPVLDQIKYFLPYSDYFGTHFIAYKQRTARSFSRSKAVDEIIMANPASPKYHVIKHTLRNLPDVYIPEQAFEVWFQFERDVTNILAEWIDSHVDKELSLFEKAEAIWLASEFGPRTFGSGGTSAFGATSIESYISPLSAAGDLLSHDGSEHTRVPIGPSGTILAVNAEGDGVEWASSNKLSTAGDLLTHDGVGEVRMAIGSPNQVLTVTSDGTDIDWVTPSTTASEFSGNLIKLNTAEIIGTNSGILAHRNINNASLGFVSTANSVDGFMEQNNQDGGREVFLDSDSSDIDDYYKGWTIKMTSGGSNGGIAKILSYDGTSKITRLDVGGSTFQSVLQFDAYTMYHVGSDIDSTYAEDTLAQPTTADGSGHYLSHNSSQVDDFYIGWYIQMVDGVAAGALAPIIAYDGTTKVATTEPNQDFEFATMGDTYWLFVANAGFIWDESAKEFAFVALTAPESGALFDAIPLMYLPSSMSRLNLLPYAGANCMAIIPQPILAGERIYTLQDAGDDGWILPTQRYEVATYLGPEPGDTALISSGDPPVYIFTKTGNLITCSIPEVLFATTTPTSGARTMVAMPEELRPSVNQLFPICIINNASGLIGNVAVRDDGILRIRPDMNTGATLWEGSVVRDCTIKATTIMWRVDGPQFEETTFAKAGIATYEDYLNLKAYKPTQLYFQHNGEWFKGLGIATTTGGDGSAKVYKYVGKDGCAQGLLILFPGEDLEDCKKRYVGKCGIDSGQLLICDPCYVLLSEMKPKRKHDKKTALMELLG
ncbi:hypothetical protein QOT17_022441 [Balamuthia mandrillaris]